MIESNFLFATCQAGAEQALKAEASARHGLRLAFSRPGFVTFKGDAPFTLAQTLPRMTFARTVGLSLGRATGCDSLSGLCGQVFGHQSVVRLLAEHAPLTPHVWRRDVDVPGTHGLRPGRDEVSRLVARELLTFAPAGALWPRDAPNRNALNGVVLDVAVVEPQEWWFGAHVVRSRTDRWPGGAPSIALPPHAVSRAYLKMREALLWSGLPMRPEDEWVEVGCSPGGACQALLDAGMRVIGIDPAEVPPELLAHENFRHIRARAAEAPRRLLAGARWLAADMNAAPKFTLDAVEPIVGDRRSRVRGLVLTLKLADWSLAAPDRLNECVERVRGWGYRDVRLRQLAFNRRELCLVALRSRSQRRRDTGRGAVGTQQPGVSELPAGNGGAPSEAEA